MPGSTIDKQINMVDERKEILNKINHFFSAHGKMVYFRPWLEKAIRFNLDVDQLVLDRVKREIEDAKYRMKGEGGNLIK